MCDCAQRRACSTICSFVLRIARTIKAVALKPPPWFCAVTWGVNIMVYRGGSWQEMLFSSPDIRDIEASTERATGKFLVQSSDNPGDLGYFPFEI